MPLSHTSSAISLRAVARGGTLGRLVRWIWTARRVKLERARLAQMDVHILRDIGISRAQALSESERSVWDVPDHWRR